MPQSPKCLSAAAKRTAAWAFFLLASTGLLYAEELKKETVAAWNQYLQWAQQKVTRELANPQAFLIQNNLSSGERAEIRQKLMHGEIVARRMPSAVPKGSAFHVPSGEIHHWWGTILLRNVTLERLMRFLQDYEHHAGKFADIERSRLLSKNDDYYRFFFRLRRSKAFVTAYYNTEQECIYTYHSPTRISSRSQALRIAEIQDPGTPSEREMQPGQDRGFLWRLVSWWRFEQTGPDVIVELESASLSRDIPGIVRFIPGVSDYIRSTPRESLESILTSIRDNVK